MTNPLLHVIGQKYFKFIQKYFHKYLQLTWNACDACACGDFDEVSKHPC